MVCEAPCTLFYKLGTDVLGIATGPVLNSGLIFLVLLVVGFLLLLPVAVNV